MCHRYCSVFTFHVFCFLVFFFQPVPNPDFIVPITIDGNVHQVYVMKRPGVDEFMQKVCQKYEVVLFTASLSKVSSVLFD